jgi:hypothetical protein
VIQNRGFSVGKLKKAKFWLEEVNFPLILPFLIWLLGNGGNGVSPCIFPN